MRLKRNLFALSSVFSLALLCSPTTRAQTEAQRAAICRPPGTPGLPLLKDASQIAALRTACDQLGNFDISRVASTLRDHGFHCDTFSKEKGLRCYGKVSSYPEDIAIVVPPGYRPTAEESLILHLHGFNGERKQDDAHPGAPPLAIGPLLAKFDLAASLARSHRNAVMIVPHANYEVEEFNSALAPSEHFEPFMREIRQLVNEAGLSRSDQVGQLVLTGHSGAFQPLATILSDGAYRSATHELYLFDSLYGRRPVFEQFARDPKHRFWSSYMPDNMEKDGKPSITARENHAMMQTLRDRNVSFGSSQGEPNDDVSQARVGFIELKCPSGEIMGTCHNHSVNREFTHFLKVGEGSLEQSPEKPAETPLPHSSFSY